MSKTQFEDAAVRGLAIPVAVGSAEAKFRRLADQWTRDAINVSSLTELTRHPHYKEIIDMGWEVVPYMLADLQNKRGYWFPALNEITGIRPFDPRQAGNFEKMTEAWITWGKNKKLI
jgi:hypothetical protein